MIKSIPIHHAYEWFKSVDLTKDEFISAISSLCLVWTHTDVSNLEAVTSEHLTNELALNPLLANFLVINVSSDLIAIAKEFKEVITSGQVSDWNITYSSIMVRMK